MVTPLGTARTWGEFEGSDFAKCPAFPRYSSRLPVDTSYRLRSAPRPYSSIVFSRRRRANELRLLGTFAAFLLARLCAIALDARPGASNLPCFTSKSVRRSACGTFNTLRIESQYSIVPLFVLLRSTHDLLARPSIRTGNPPASCHVIARESSLLGRRHHSTRRELANSHSEQLEACETMVRGGDGSSEGFAPKAPTREAWDARLAGSQLGSRQLSRRKKLARVGHTRTFGACAETSRQAALASTIPLLPFQPIFD